MSTPNDAPSMPATAERGLSRAEVEARAESGRTNKVKDSTSRSLAEIIRAGIEAVDRGQTEAGRSLGLSQAQTMKSIIMPQAVKNILPALGNEFIVLIKETAIMGGIAIRDVTQVARNVGSSNYDYLTPLIIAAVMYLVVVIILTKLLGMFERRLAKSDRR